MLFMKLSICLSPILTSQLSKKGPKIIVTLLTPMLKTANSSENLLTLVNVVEKDEVINRNVTSVAIQILPKFKNIEELSKVGGLEQLFKLCNFQAES